MNEPYLINQSLENLYDIYSPVMYGIALQITRDEKTAEKILITAFRKLSRLQVNVIGNSGICLKLAKLTIETTGEIHPGYQKQDLKSRLVVKTPILYSLISENSPVETLCKEYQISMAQLMNGLRRELTLLTKAKRKYLVRIITVAA